MTVAVLFAHRRSVYKAIDGVDVWDEDRDARLWPGGVSLVAHPPCRAWGRFSAFAKPEAHERQLAIDAVAHVRRWGVVIEHPAFSKLWTECQLPTGSARDRFGGFTLHVDQLWWGHPCRKATFLYIAGIERSDVPPFEIPFTLPSHVIETNRARRGKGERLPYLPHSRREHTPLAFAKFLVELARRCSSPGVQS